MTGPLVPIVNPPGTGTQYFQYLLVRCGVQAPGCHHADRVSWHKNNGAERFVVMVRDWECSLASLSPDREPRPRDSAITLMRDVTGAQNPDVARQLAYAKLLAAVFATSLPWRFVTYESLLIHPAPTLATTLDWIGVDPSPPYAPGFWSDPNAATRDGNLRRYPAEDRRA